MCVCVCALCITATVLILGIGVKWVKVYLIFNEYNSSTESFVRKTINWIEVSSEWTELNGGTDVINEIGNWSYWNESIRNI